VGWWCVVSLLAVGLSHRTAPVSVLERTALADDVVDKLLRDIVSSGHASEAVVLATCNRTELYADVAKFHGGVNALSELLSRHSGVGLDELTSHLCVHYEDRAVQHLFSVACGLESMVVGEGQVLGQIKAALGRAQRVGSAGRALNDLFQQALRVGKRAHSETEIDRAGQSLVTVALSQAQAELGSLAGASALIIGAGSMSGLAASTLRRAGLDRIVVANRTHQRAVRLARSVSGEAAPLAEASKLLAEVDLVVSCTGATGLVLGAGELAGATAGRERPLVVLDLALPRDVDPAARSLPGVRVIDLERLADITARENRALGVAAVTRIVNAEVTAFADAQSALRVAPTVVALRAMAADVVDSELARFVARLPELDGRVRDEVTQTVRRVVDKLLHAPTVRVKELASEPGGASYAEALRELFGLDPTAVDVVSRADPNAVDGVA
jgi:glutamyl-tRNA reductase